VDVSNALEEAISRDFGDPAPAIRAVPEVLAHGLGRGIVELAQPEGTEHVIRRVRLCRSVHRPVSGDGESHGF
jgi:hypothetical protein